MKTWQGAHLIHRIAIVLALAALSVVASAIILENETVARIFVYAASIAVLAIFFHQIRTSETSERAGLIAALILTLQTVFFFIFYQQMSTSLAQFTLRDVKAEQ